MRYLDGSAGDADYGVLGMGYARYRQPERRIAEPILRALADARTVLNVGAGAGSYEPTDREVTAVEPSASMREQRPAHLSAAIDAVAESLPFPDNHFHAAMASFTIHQWPDLAKGLSEMRRVTGGPVVILSCDPLLIERFWLSEYAPLVLGTEARRYPALDRVGTLLGGSIEIQPVPIPLDCRDGFCEAYYGRPEMFLEPGARLACSAWSFVEPSVNEASIEHLRQDLADGSWDARYGHLRTQPEFDGSLRLLVARVP